MFKKQTKWDLKITVSRKLVPVYHLKRSVKALLWWWGEEKQISLLLSPREISLLTPKSPVLIYEGVISASMVSRGTDT